jgi:hypothetical protein
MEFWQQWTKNTDGKKLCNPLLYFKVIIIKSETTNVKEGEILGTCTGICIY